MQRTLRFTTVLFVLSVMIPLSASAKHKFKASLSGYSEVPPVSTDGSGDFDAEANKDETAIDYELSFDGLSASTTAAHIHFGQAGVNGAVSAFLCGGGSAPTCPASGAVSGTITAADVIGPAAQGIAAGELAELIRAIRAGVTYVNVHTTAFPSGEIRGQVDH